MLDDMGIFQNTNISEYSTTNSGIKNALDKQRTFLNKWRDSLSKQKTELERERTRLSGITLMSRELSMAYPLATTATSEKLLLNLTWLDLPDVGPKEIMLSKSMQQDKKFKFNHSNHAALYVPLGLLWDGCYWLQH